MQPEISYLFPLPLLRSPLHRDLVFFAGWGPILGTVFGLVLLETFVSL